MTKTFAGYVIGMARQNVRQARSVALYVVKRTDTKTKIMERVDADLKKGGIDRDRRDRLRLFLDELHAEYARAGKTVDERNSREWEELGNGARRKKAIMDSDQM